MALIVPTIGRVILVQRGASDASGPWPALVTKIWSDRCINAAGFNEWGTPVAFSSLCLVQEGDEVPAAGPYAEWMPYQKGQAAKTEALQAQLAQQPPVDNAHVAAGCEQFSDPAPDLQTR